ncbi:MAG: hypothetical protein JZU53_14025 [Paludibacter sp.]|nr:hypothetical protein [Paludibacter sp.]
MNKLTFSIVLFFITLTSLFAQSPAPTGLLCQLMSHPELSVITEKNPEFGWIVNSDKPGDSQKAYQILVASSAELLQNNMGDMWNSGKVKTAQSINVGYAGKALSANKIYYWKVKTYNKKSGENTWSLPQQFNTGEFDRTTKWPGESRWLLIDNGNGQKSWALENRHPVVYHLVKPVRKTIRDNGAQFFDFGRSAFATVEINLTWTPKDTAQKELTLKINIGEKGVGDSIDQKPGGGVIFRTFPMTIKSGTANYTLQIPRFVPKFPHSQPMPPQMPEIIPFRFCEVLSGTEKVTVNDITHKALYILDNEKASGFKSSNSDLNAIYELCKYSTVANTFNGDYANSERERMMYEADCYIQQMGHYAVDREFAIARYSLENLLYHATWPSEWISHSVFMAWADYLYTGNTDVITRYYDDIKAKTMTALQSEKSLISTQTGKQTKEFLKSIHYNGATLRDIVDWPNASYMSTVAGGESDGYDFRDYNTVVNAFYYQSMVYMAKMSDAIGKKNDARLFSAKVDSVKSAFNKNFFNSETGIYVDGIGSKHSSLHANMYPLCFGLVPTENQKSVINFIKSKRMACGVYSSNYLLEAMFDYNQTDYAMSLLTDDSDRSWLNMIRVGATMTTEAWDNKYKLNNGWSHAWSASPAHIIPRKIMGIEPAEPGFGKINIRPRPGNLTEAKAKVSTIRGDIDVGFKQEIGKSFELNITIPANTTANVYMPTSSKKYTLIIDGKKSNGQYANEYTLVKNASSGSHKLSISYE